MRARRDRSRPTSLRLTQLEDRSVPAGFDAALPPPPPFDPAHVEVGLDFNPPTTVLGGTHFLTAPQAGDGLTLARQALANFAGAMNLTSADVTDAKVTDYYRDSSGAGMAHAYFRQTHNGLPVLNTSIGVHVMPDGRILSLAGGFVSGLNGTAGAVPTPAYGAADAVAEAAAYFGITLASAPTLTSSTTSLDAQSTVSELELSGKPIDARLVYVNTAGGVRLAWHFNIDVPAPDQWLDVAVDTQTGQVTFWSNWVDAYSATYNALPYPNNDPQVGPRVITVNPADPIASPFGWQDNDGDAAPEYTDTRGNNVFAQFDPFDVNSSPPFTASSNRPDAGSGLVFNYPLNLAAGPSASVDAAVTNLFYQNNVLHDLHFKYGFDEAAGNFQFHNYTSAGLGGDQVEADVQDGSALGYSNNAFFGTAPDGQVSNMIMLVFDLTNPFRDSSFANDVITHEFGHGVSNRLTGGPANANGLNNLQSVGMGEGWSDFWATMFTQKPGDTKDGGYVTGAWLFGNPASGPGIRRFPYSFDKAVDPLTFEIFGNTGNVSYTTTAGGTQSYPRSTESHDAGEIWASALWDMNWLLIDKYGFDKDLSTGYAPGNTPASAGNKLALQLVMDGLKLQPAEPSFTQARDAILAADLALTQGQNQREIWTAFARRGLGFAAFTNNSGDASVNTDFNLPPNMSRPAIIGVSPAAKTIGGPAPTSITFTFSEQMNPASFDHTVDVLAFSGPTPTGQGDLRGSITTATWSAGNTQLTINFTPSAGVFAQGNYSIRLSPNILSADTPASQLDQNADGNAGTVADQFTANFRYDAKALSALLTSSPSAADPSLPGSIIAVFNEAIDVASVSIADLQVSEGTVVAATPIRSNPNDPNSPVLTVRYDLIGITTAPVYVTLKYGSVTDPYGFPVEEANASFGRLEIPATPFPTPLPSYGPLGWEAFGGQVTGNLTLFGQVDSYAIQLDAGQSLSVVADQLTSLRAQVRLFDPSGNPIALATGAQQGDPVSVGPVVAPAPGRYVMQITGPGSSTGPYRLRALLGAIVETETSNPSAENDFQFDAEDLDGLIAVQGGPGSTLQAVTIAGNVGMDRPGGPFDPDDTSDYYTFTAIAGQRTSVGLARPAGGSTLILSVSQGFGFPLTPDVPAPTNFDGSVTFVPTATGTYTIRVQNNNVSARGTDYALAVVLNGVMDTEGNNSSATAQNITPRPSPVAPPLPLPGNVRGGLNSATGDDWYAFTLTATTDVYLTSLTPGDGPNQPDNFLDPTIELQDAAGADVGTASDNGAGDGKNAIVFAEALAPGTYRFRVRPSPLASTTTSGEYIIQITTSTVAVPVNPGPVNVSTGGPYDVTEGQSKQLTATATDPNNEPLTYTWDLNGDGVFDDAVGRTPTVTWAQFRALGISDGPGTFSIQVRVSDGTNAAVTSVPSSLNLINGNPLGALYIGDTGTVTTLTVNEGSSSVVVRLASPTDATAAPYDPASLPLGPDGRPLTLSLDDSIGLRYSFDLDGNGLYDDDAGDGTYAGSLSSPQVTVPPETFADGPGTVTVRGLVIDKDNGSSVYTVTFTIDNVVPNITAAALVGTLANGTGVLTEGTQGRITLNGATDAAADLSAGLRYSFDLDNDGLFDDGAGDGTYAGSLTTPSVLVPSTLFPDGPGSVTFRVKVIDKDDGTIDPISGLPVAGSVTASYTLSYVNAPPTGTPVVLVNNVVTPNPVVNEGTGVTLRVDAVTDPSGADQTFGFTYQYDFNYTGTFVADITTTANTAAVPVPNNLDDGDATLMVAVRVIDRNGDFSETVLPIGVLNVAPTATVTADPVTIGTAVSVTLNGQDVSSVDQTAGFLYSFDFNGDGDFTDPDDVLNSPSASATFNYATPGIKTINGRISDKVRGTSTPDDSNTYPISVEVINVQPTATVTVPPTIVEGASASASVTVVGNHVSNGVKAAGFSFEFDFDGNGVIDLSVPRDPSNPVSSYTAPIPASFTNDGTRPLSVRVRVIESFNNLSTEVVAPVQVTNANPTALFSGPTGEVRVADQLTFTFTGGTDASPVDLTSLKYSFDLNNDGDFTDDGEVADSATPTLTASFRTGGTKIVRGRVSDKDGGVSDYTVPVTVIAPTKGGYAAGTDFGNAPSVQLYNANGSLKFRTNAFESNMTGGVRVAVADVNGDGVPDVVAGTGPGFTAEVRVIDGKNGSVMFSTRPFEGFTGGVFVAAADMDGDGKAEFVVSPDMGGGPRVIVYRGNGFIQTLSFFGIDDPAFRGGARVGLADMNADGRADLIVSAGFEGGPRVAGFEGSGLLTGVKTKLFNDFFAFEEGLRNGAFVTGGDVNGDGFADLIAGAGPGGAPRVVVYDGQSLVTGKKTQLASFFTGNDESRGGVRVAVADIDSDGLADVVTGEADGPRVNIFFGKNVKNGLPGDDIELMPFSTPMNGVFVG